MTMQKKKTTVRDVIVIGFALFSMFFGAGNVVFPPYLGLEAGPEWLTGFTTYFIADIGLALVAAGGQQRGCPEPCGPRSRRDFDVRHHSVHRPHGSHPPYLRQHL